MSFWHSRSIAPVTVAVVADVGEPARTFLVVGGWRVFVGGKVRCGRGGKECRVQVPMVRKG